MKEPSLEGIVNDLTVKGLKQLIELAEARLLELGDSEQLALKHAREKGW